MKNLFVSLFLVYSVCFSLFGQNANSISGKIISGGTPVAGATIYLLNTNFGTTSDKEGNYKIESVPLGKYTLKVSAIGYAATIKNNILENGQSQNLDIELKESTNQLDEIVVTAQKTEELSQKIPLAISTISAKQIQEYRLWNSKDITAIVPNLYSGNSGDDRNVTSIRGISTTSYDPAVATYIDGINQFTLDSYISQLIDVERIEVLRGPQGTLYGRNAMGGVINIITKQPTNVTKGFVEMNIGSYGQQRYALGVKTPIIKDKLFLGVSGIFDKRDGFYTNDFNNSPFEKFQNVTGNYFLKYLASPKLSFTVNVKHANNRNHGAFPLAFGDDAFANPYHVNQNAIAKTIDNTFNSSLAVNYFGDQVDFTSTTAYQKNYRYYQEPIDGDFSSLDMLTIVNNYGKNWNNTKTLTQEFKFSSSSKINLPLKWTAGMYSFYQENPVKQASHYGEYAKYLGAPDSLFSTTTTSSAYNFGIAFFGQATYSFGKIDLTAGLRYDSEHKKQSVLGEYQKDPSSNPTIQTQPDTSSTANFNAISPKLSLSYHFSEDHNLYATYARGFRAGGLLNDPSTPLYVYNPEHSNNFEIGLKNTFFNNRFQANITAFLIHVSDAQVPTLILPQALTITKNAGKLNSSGIELELLAKPFKGLQVDYNLGLNNAKFTTLNLTNNDNSGQINYNGNHQIFTPSATSMFALQYSLDLETAQKMQVVLRGEWRYLGKQYFDLQNTISQNGYSVLNAKLGLTARNFEIMFWGRNLTDKKYIEYAYSFGGIHLGNPFNYGVTVTGRF